MVLTFRFPTFDSCLSFRSLCVSRSSSHQPSKTCSCFSSFTFYLALLPVLRECIRLSIFLHFAVSHILYRIRFLFLPFCEVGLTYPGPSLLIYIVHIQSLMVKRIPRKQDTSANCRIFYPFKCVAGLISPRHPEVVRESEFKIDFRGYKYMYYSCYLWEQGDPMHMRRVPN
jgi:hypothetical protein